MHPIWTAHEGDDLGAHAIRLLRDKCNQKTRMLVGNGACFEKPAVLLFTSDGSFASRFMLITPHNMTLRKITMPSYASGSPLCVALNRYHATNILKGNDSDFRVALGMLVAGYEAWNPTRENVGAPWKPFWHKGEAPPSFTEWQRTVLQYAVP